MFWQNRSVWGILWREWRAFIYEMAPCLTRVMLGIMSALVKFSDIIYTYAQYNVAATRNTSTYTILDELLPYTQYVTHAVMAILTLPCHRDQKQQHKPVGFYGLIVHPVLNAPISKCPQFGVPPSFDRCMPLHRRFNQHIPLSVVLLQQCHWRNRHRGKLKIYLVPQFCSNRVEFFYNTQETQTQKMMHQNFEIRILWFFRIFLNLQKGVARSLCGRSGPLWSWPN